MPLLDGMPWCTARSSPARDSKPVHVGATARCRPYETTFSQLAQVAVRSASVSRKEDAETLQVGFGGTQPGLERGAVATYDADALARPPEAADESDFLKQ
jgi:hypothetical protein